MEPLKKMDYKNQNKILITGAGGMVGSYIDCGIKTTRRDLDVTDLNETMEIIKSHKPEAIIHLAAETDMDRCERDPKYAYLVNSIGTYNVAVAAKKIGAKLIYVSTMGIFGGSPSVAYSETSEPNPQNYYSHSKYIGELIIKGMLDDYIIARAGWIFGGGPLKDKKFVAKIIKQFNLEEIKAVNDISNSPIYAKDLVFAIKKLIEENQIGTFHLTNAGSCSGYELALEIVKIMGKKVKVIPVSSDYFNSRVKRGNLISVSNNGRPARHWKEALKEYLEMEWKQFIAK